MKQAKISYAKRNIIGMLLIATLLILSFTINLNFAAADKSVMDKKDYVLDKNIVYVNNPEYYISTEPAVLTESGWVTFKIKLSKDAKFDKSTKFLIGFNTKDIIPLKVKGIDAEIVHRSFDYQAAGLTEWYSIKLNLEKKKETEIKVYFQIVPEFFSVKNVDTKYWVGLMPDKETLESVTTTKKDLLYALDPWVNSSGANQNKDYLTTGLVAYYKLEETTGTIIDNYQGIFNTTGIYNGNVTGIINKAYNLSDFNNTIIDFTPSNLSIKLNESRNFTISYWLKPRFIVNLSDYEYIFTTDNVAAFYVVNYLEGGSAGVGDNANTTCIGADGKNNACYRYSAPTEWTNYIVQYEQNNTGGYNLSLYINGSIVNSSLAFNLSLSPIFYFGTSSVNNHHYNGFADEIAFWNRTLNHTEINDIYNSGRALQYHVGSEFILSSPVDNSTVSSISLTAQGNLMGDIGTVFTNWTFYVWNSSNFEINKSFNIITGTSNLTTVNISRNIPIGYYHWNVLFCYIENCSWAMSNSSFNYGYIMSDSIYNNVAYETSIEDFKINMTYNSAMFSSINAKLYYNGTSQGTATIISTGDTISFYDTVNIPLVNGDTIKQFYWQVNLISLDGSSYTSNTSLQNQTVKNIYFVLCNDTINITYINFTIKDEMSPWPYINSTIPSATFNYWLGDGSITEQYVYSNSTESLSHGFCFSPNNRTLNVNYIYQAGSLGYYTRVFNSLVNLPLTNSSTNQLFYLIQSADSGAVVIQIIDSSSNTILPGALLTIVRDINGVPTQIYAGLSDSAGAVVAYLSSLVSYTITVTKTGCGTNSQTITPATGSYTMNLNCGGNTTKFVSTIDGVSYQRTPKEGISIPGTTTYRYYVLSTTYPIYSAKFELYDSTANTLLGSNQTDVSSGYAWCTTNNCSLSLIYTAASGDNIKGKYYVNLGNVTNNTWVLLEGDAYWRYININPNNSQQAWNRIILQFNEFMDTWGSKSANCIVYTTNATCAADTSCKWVNQSTWGPDAPNFRTDTSLCVLKDDINKMEFNRILLIFSGIVLVLFILGKTIGYEMSNPGSFVMIMSMCIIILSIGGLFTFNGLTQYDFFNQYIFAYICSVFSAGYSLSIVRRYSA